MSPNSRNTIAKQQNGIDDPFRGHSVDHHDKNNTDDSLVSINYTRTDEPIGDANPIRRNEIVNTSGTSSNDNTRMELALASPNTSMKELKKTYHLRKKFFTKNIQSAIDSTQEVHSGWLKARTTFKRWTKTWCQVKPGYLILYTSQEAQKKHRLGVVLLSVCQVIKRPTKKDGYCFKLINPFGCSVWAKSSTKAIVFAHSSLTIRVSDDSIGKLWLDALNRCHLSSNLEGYQSIVDDNDPMIRSSGTNSRLGDTGDSSGDEDAHLAYILNHSNTTSENASLSSFQRNNNNNQSLFKQTNGRPHMNGNTLTNDPESERSHKPGDNAHRKQNRDFNPSSLKSTNDETIKRGSSSQVKRITDNKRFLSDKSPSKSSGTMLAGSSGTGSAMSSNYSKMVAKFSKYNWKELQLENVNYVEDGMEELGSAGIQSEEVHESNKNFLWHIIKQLRPGMDLSKVTLPTFILEPRSFLEKLADYYYHCDILSEAVQTDEPTSRLISIVKWYLSGFYKKPKGPKKPYNPILGERFRCFWDHPKTRSRTFFIAEQVSHHPPISAFHVSNRKDGFTITCALLSRSKYGGNSVSAILDGKAKLYLNKRKETYTITMPYANCRGILLGSLCMELGGKVEIECAETGCKCELDFKLASMWANQSSYNTLTGRILKDNKVTHTLDGHWDKKINIVNKSTEVKSTLWEVTDFVRNSRLKRYTVSLKDQNERESVKLWSKVTEALIAGNQVLATTEKTRLEDMQRQEARDRTGLFIPRHFEQPIPGSGEWSYRWQDDRLWEERRDIMQFEEDFRVRTLMLGPIDTEEGQSPALTDNDLPLTRLSRFASQIQSLTGGAELGAPSRPNAGKGSVSKDTFQVGDLNEETMRSLESRIVAGNLQFKEALKQVTEKNRKLEEDIALMKRARGKRTLALFMTAIIIALISVLYKIFS